MSTSGKMGGSLNGSSRPTSRSSLSGRLITLPPFTTSRRATPVGAVAAAMFTSAAGSVIVPSGSTGSGVTTGSTGSGVTTGTGTTVSLLDTVTPGAVVVLLTVV